MTLLEKIDRIPWIPFSAKGFLDDLLHQGMRVFEWGSGGSTLYFAERVMSVISVENDQDWYDKVSRELVEGDFQNVTLFLKLPCPGVVEESISAPGAYYERGFPGLNFKDYVTVIDSWPDQKYDLILVDGQARPSCIVHAIPRLRESGWLILDNSDREFYLTDVHTLLRSWERHDFLGHGPYNSYQWGCSLWRKPR